MGCQVQRLFRLASTDAGFYNYLNQSAYGPCNVLNGQVSIAAGSLIVENELDATVYLSIDSSDPQPRNHAFLIPPRTLWVMPVSGLTRVLGRALYDWTRNIAAPREDTEHGATVAVTEAALPAFVGPILGLSPLYAVTSSPNTSATAKHNLDVVHCPLGTLRTRLELDYIQLTAVCRTAGVEGMIVLDFWDITGGWNKTLGAFYFTDKLPLSELIPGPLDMVALVAGIWNSGDAVELRLSIYDVVGAGTYDVTLSTLRRGDT